MQTTEHTYIEVNGIKLHVVQDGPQGGKLVILLHGFPEFWYGWRKQISYLASKGYRIWAPDQRGYNLSDKPKRVRDYKIDLLAKDVAGLIDASGAQKTILVGHDWGGIVAWRVAMEYPELLNQLIILNAPHPKAMSKQLHQHPLQIVRSSYIAFFQLRGIPERLFKQSNWKVLVNALRKSSQKETFSDGDMQQYRISWSRPDAMRSMLHWYRAFMLKSNHSNISTRVTVPTLLIWGARDLFLGPELVEKSLAYCDDGRGVLLGEATHWLHQEEPKRVNQLIVEFINEK